MTRPIDWRTRPSLWPRSSICSASLASAASSAVKVGVVTGQHLPAISGPVVYRPLAAATYRTSLLPSKTDYKDMRSEEHTSELQSLMPNAYAGLCLQKKNKK